MPPKRVARNTQIAASSRMTRSPGVFPSEDEAKLVDLSSESRMVVSILSNKIDKLIVLLTEKEERIQHLEVENSALRKSLNKIEERIENFEALERRNRVVLSGEALPPAVPGEITTQVVVDTLKASLRYEIAASNIIDAIRVGAKPMTQTPDRRNILVHLRNTEEKNDLITACRRGKPTNFYINENLTPARSHILYILRQLRRRNGSKIDHCGSRDGKVYFWFKPNDDGGRNRKFYVNSIETLRKLCEELNIDHGELMPVTEHE